MAEDRRCGISGCGWLLIIMGVFTAGVALLAWLVRLELRNGGGAGDVWVTDSGSRYHLRECTALARSEPHAITLQEARREGLQPCDLCEPPA
jgi:hypothetical protein